MADQSNQFPDHVAAADLIDRLSCAVDYDYATDDLHRKHYPCLRDDLGDLHHDLLNAPNTATVRVVKVVTDAARAARIDELRQLLEDWPNLRTDTIRDRITELEADRG